jgi:hypothetical protein
MPSSDSFEKALDGVGRVEIETRWRRAVFEKEEMEKTLGIAQAAGTALHNENVELKNCLRVARILLENGKPSHALECICAALPAPLSAEELPGNEDHR